ncbi:MAG TPA: thiamine diphosphokinase, partial [Ilumatobacteraceae bacterium]|nr:thiamine diphosphokinase [Ilumatobacteraceae bacterium]
MSQVVVVIGGGALSPRHIADIAPDAVIVAADSGLDHAVEAGLRPTILVGDLDSITAHGKMWAYAHELEIDQHPLDKASTDTELALARAVQTEATDLLVFGAIGDRFDHALGTL